MCLTARVGGVTREGRGVEQRPRGSCINIACVCACTTKTLPVRVHASSCLCVCACVCVSPSPFKLKGLYLACV